MDNSLSTKEYSILLVSKDLNSQGGVVSVVSMLMNHFSIDVNCRHFRIGTTHRSHKLPINLLFPIFDCIRLVYSVLTHNFDSVCLNSSMGLKAILRDGFFLAAISFIKYKNTTVFFHGWNLHFAERIRYQKFFRKCFRRVFIKSCKIIVLAPNFKQTLIDIGIPEDKIYVTTTMFEADFFRKYKSEKYKTIPKTLLYLSRFQREKGAFETIEAVDLLRFKFPEIKLIMAGDGPERASLERLVKDRSLSKQVSFTGYVRDFEKMRVLKSAEIFVFPTYYGEGCPVSLIEAMAAGLAIITTSVGAIPDIINDGENGILLEDINPATIANAIKTILSQPKQLNIIKKNNIQKAITNYEAKKVTKNIEYIFFSKPST